MSRIPWVGGRRSGLGSHGGDEARGAHVGPGGLDVVQAGLAGVRAEGPMANPFEDADGTYLVDEGRRDRVALCRRQFRGRSGGVRTASAGSARRLRTFGEDRGRAYPP